MLKTLRKHLQHSQYMEYQILYTKEPHKKSKAWHDGTMRVFKINKKLIVYNDSNIEVFADFVNEYNRYEVEQTVKFPDFWILIDGFIGVFERDVTEKIKDANASDWNVQASKQLLNGENDTGVDYQKFASPTVKKRQRVLGLSRGKVKKLSLDSTTRKDSAINSDIRITTPTTNKITNVPSPSLLKTPLKTPKKESLTKSIKLVNIPLTPRTTTARTDNDHSSRIDRHNSIPPVRDIKISPPLTLNKTTPIPNRNAQYRQQQADKGLTEEYTVIQTPTTPFFTPQTEKRSLRLDRNKLTPSITMNKTLIVKPQSTSTTDLSMLNTPQSTGATTPSRNAGYANNNNNYNKKMVETPDSATTPSKPQFKHKASLQIPKRLEATMAAARTSTTPTNSNNLKRLMRVDVLDSDPDVEELSDLDQSQLQSRRLNNINNSANNNTGYDGGHEDSGGGQVKRKPNSSIFDLSKRLLKHQH